MFGNYWARPPEVTSALIYDGPGSSSMMAAAVGWDAVALELGTAACGYAAVIAELTSGRWIGRAASLMVVAAAPYAEWLQAAAIQAEQTASQARAAAAAYEAAFSMTVPPPAVTGNRVLLRTLIATNFFGQNSPAIAATEAEYGEMWAQDAAAMYVYAGSAAAATVLTPFTPPPMTTDLAGPHRQAVAVGRAAATAEGAGQAAISPTIWRLAGTSAVSRVLEQLSVNAVFPWYAAVAQWLAAHIPVITPAERTTLVRLAGLSYFGLGMAQFSASIAQVLIPGSPSGAGDSGSSVVDSWGPKLRVGASSGAGTAAEEYWQRLDGLARPVSAVMGKAGSTGSLSTPSSWGGSVRALPATALEEQLDVVGSLANAKSNALLQGMPMTPAGRHTAAADQRYGFRYRVMQRPPSAG